jgi:UDP-4-amino-4,6-dideoxy-N-acetyl-beta-L-altrosamine transaminase
MSVPPATLHDPSASFLPYGRQCVDQDDIDAVVAVLRSDFLTTGPTVDAYEAAFAKAVQAPHAVACSSGTAGLHLATLALGLGEGDVVIVPSVTFLASANCAVYVGARAVFADVDPRTGLITVETAREALDRAAAFGRPKALVAVHLNGHCADVAGLARAFPDLSIIEDACHALGGMALGGMALDGKGGEPMPVGACPDSAIAMFSTHPVKTLATGEGGMMTTRDDVLAERMRRLRSHGIERDPEKMTDRALSFDANGEVNPWSYEMPEPGYNYRLNDIQAALGLSQIGKLEHFVAVRRRLRARYEVLLGEIAVRTDGMVAPLPTAPGCEPAWHLSVALIDFDALGVTRAEVMRALKAMGIGSQVHYTPVHLQPYYRALDPDLSLPGAMSYYRRCLSLPLYPAMDESDVDRVVEALRTVLGV